MISGSLLSKIQLRSFHLLAIIKVVGSPLLIDPMCLNWVGAYSMGLTRVTTLHGLWCHLHCMLISNKCNYNSFFQRITFDIYVIIVQESMRNWLCSKFAHVPWPLVRIKRNWHGKIFFACNYFFCYWLFFLIEFSSNGTVLICAYKKWFLG